MWGRLIGVSSAIAHGRAGPLPPQRGTSRSPPQGEHRLPRLRHHRQLRRQGPYPRHTCPSGSRLMGTPRLASLPTSTARRLTRWLLLHSSTHCYPCLFPLSHRGGSRPPCPPALIYNDSLVELSKTNSRFSSECLHHIFRDLIVAQIVLDKTGHVIQHTFCQTNPKALKSGRLRNTRPHPCGNTQEPLHNWDLFGDRPGLAGRSENSQFLKGGSKDEEAAGCLGCFDVCFRFSAGY